MEKVGLLTRFRNPFYSTPSIDESNYLQVRVENFINLASMPEDFYRAIDTIVVFRNVLLSAQAAGRLDSVNNRLLYLDILKWLKREVQLTAGVVVTPIAEYTDINEAIAASFLQHVQHIRDNYLRPEPLYNQIELNFGILKAVAQQKIEQGGEDALQNFDKDILRAQTNLSTNIEEQKRIASENSNILFSEQRTQIRALGESIKGEIKQATVLSEWNSYYQEKIDHYQVLLSGENWKCVDFTKSLKSLKRELKVRLGNANEKRKKVKHLSKEMSKVEKKRRWWSSVKYLVKGTFNIGWYFIKGSYAFLSRLLRYFWSKVKSTKAIRSFWFVVLAVMLSAQSYVLIQILIGNPVLGHILTATSTTGSLTSTGLLTLKISIFLGFILMPSLGYASANKNYRIYLNLLEQYKHRATVARTVQGMLRQIDEQEHNKDVREKFAAVAAVAMFENKPVGHLTKKDTLPMGDLFGSIIGK